MRKIILLTALLAQSFIVEGQNRKDAPTYLPNYTPPSPSVAALMKFEEVPVDNYTGIPDVSIPIFSVTAKDAKLKFNINLKYHPSSVAVDEFASDVGLGWSLFAGGTISRTVKDLPDDILIYGKRAGIYQTEVIGSQNNYYNVVDILNNGIQTTQEQEIVDEFYWEANEKKKYDTQHDLWQFNFMGKSGRFYIKKNMTTGLLEIVPLENYNLKIKNYYQTTNNNYPGQPKYTPTSFEIIDTEGYKYLFEEFEETKTSTYSESLHFSGLLAMHPSNPITEKKYRSAFHLTKILDMSGNTLIEISYSDDFNESTITRTDVTNNSEFYATIPLDLIEQGVGEWCPEGGEAAILKTEPLSMFTLSHPEVNVKKIKDILINGVSKIHLKFEKGREDTYYYNENKGCRLTEISINDLSDVLNRKFNFKYHYDGLINIRLFLNEIDIKDKDSSEVYNYKFEYNNGTGVNIGTDYWKYYNSTATCDIGTKSKEVTPSLCTTDVLQKIKLPTGGCEIFDYESNEYTFIQGDEIGNFDENSSNWDIEPDYVNLNLQSTLGIVSYESIGYHSTPTRFIFHSSIDNNEGLNGFLKLYKKDLQLPLGHQYVLCQQLDELCPSELTVDGGFEYFVGFSWNASAGAGQNIPPNLPATGNAYVYIDKKTRAVDYKNFLYGGGIRIKKIGYFDTEVNKDYYKWNEYYSLYDSPSKEINYGYRLKSDPSKSSGVLIHPKPLYSYTKWTRVCADCFPFNGNLQVDYTTQTSYNNLLVNKTKGADVGYQNVTVYETGNGRTEFEYTIDIDGEEITDVSPPFLPSENHDYKRGLLVRQNIFDDLGKHLKK